VGSAARSFRAVLRRDPGDANAWYQLALATGSASARAQALRLDPHGPASFRR
jgi:cytochrome c-type biogenesis protein CcmH/NrfG